MASIRNCVSQSGERWENMSNVNDIKIAVDGWLTMEQGHQIARAVRRQLLQKSRHVQDVMVHVNPHRPDQRRQM